MTREELKEFIRANLIDCHNGLKGVNIEKALEKNNYYAFLLDETSFLANTSTTGEKLYCINNDLTQIPICSNCNEKTYFVSFKTGYFKFCCYVCKSFEEQGKISKKDAKNLLSNELTKEIVQDYIKNNFYYKKTGYLIDCNRRKKLNGNVQIQNFINQNTKFLNNEYTDYERIYCFVNNINELKVCSYCETKLQFKDSTYGYSKTCEKKDCRLKDWHSIQNNGLTKVQNMVSTRNEYQRNNIDENGLDGFQRCAIKGLETKRNTILSSGISILKDNGRKSRDTLRERYGEDYFSDMMLKKCERLKNDVDDSGLNGLQRRALKSVEIKKLDIVDGLDMNVRCAIKSAETMKKVQKDGTTIYQNNAIKCQETQIRNATEKGDDGFINKSKSVITRYENTGLVCQGGLERTFLNFIKEVSMLDKIKRGPTIRYLDYFSNKFRNYFSDYYIQNIFEVKSKWTYDRSSKVLSLRKTCNSKFKAALEAGYKLYIVWGVKDKIFLQQILRSDFVNIDVDLYQPSKFIPLNKENFLKIFQ